ncbi:MAG: nuclear transport factor 2 family protein [Thermoanaerobaculia bacterium]
MRTLRRALLLLSCGLIVGCSAPASETLSAAREAEIAATLLSITETYNAVWEELDLDKISNFHADDFTYYRRGVVDSASQTDFLRAYHDNVATQITGYWATPSETRVRVLGLNAGLVAFVFRGGVELPDGSKVGYDGALTYVFERRNEEWKIVHIHESEYRPGAA